MSGEISMNFYCRRYKVAKKEKVQYRPDAEHKNKPEEGTWYATKKGWTTAKPKSELTDGKGENKSPATAVTETKEEIPEVTETKEEILETKEEKGLAEKKEQATKSIEEYYGEINSEEKTRIESEAAEKLMDYIRKASKGEEADLPELSDDDKERFIECMFIALKAKQIQSIPAITPQLKRQRDDVVAKLYAHVQKGLESVVESLSTKGLVEKNISPKETEVFKSLPEKSNKNIKDMDDEEFSNHLLLNRKRDFQKQFIKKPFMRGKNFSDLSKIYQEKAKEIAETAAIYAKNFGSFNPRLKKTVKIKKGSDKVGFILGKYKENPNSYYSDVTLPIDSEFDKIPHALNDLMKTLGASGFVGKIEITTNAENMAMNKNNIRIITDNPKHLASANEIAKQSFFNQGIDTKTQIVKKQFGMTEDNQFAYRSKLKMLAIKAGKKGKISIPPSDVQNYMIAARLSGFDLVPDENKFSLRSHNPNSAIGQLRLNTDDNPKEVLANLQKALKDESLPRKQYKEIPTEDLFHQIRIIHQELADKGNGFDDDIEDSYGNDFDNPRQEKLQKDRKTPKGTEETPQNEETLPVSSEPSAEPEPSQEAVPEKQEEVISPEPQKPLFSDTIKDMVSSLEEKVKAKDHSVVNDFDAMLQGIQSELQKNPDAFSLKQYQKAINMSAAALLRGGYLQKMSADVTKRFESLNNEIKTALIPPVPMTSEQLNLDKIGKHSQILQMKDSTKSALLKNDIVGDDGYSSGWFSNGKEIYSSDFKHRMDFGSPEEAEHFAKSHPYLDKNKHLSIDPLDNDEKEVVGNRLIVNKKPDTSRMSSFTSKYKIPEESPEMRELLGFKRLLLSKMGNDDRAKVRQKGFIHFLSNESAGQLQKDFIEKMSENNYKGNDFIEEKKKMALIDPNDFVKMIALIGEAKTASFVRRAYVECESKINAIAIKINY